MKNFILAILLFIIVAFGGFLYRNALEMSARNNQYRLGPVVNLEQATTSDAGAELATTTATTTTSTTPGVQTATYTATSTSKKPSTTRP